MGTDLDFKPHVFLSFGKIGYPLNKVVQAAKTHGSCKPNAHWCANVQHEPGTDLDFCVFLNI